MDIDHLLLAIEALNLQAMDAMLDLVHRLEFDRAFPHRVAFWRARNTNPLRRHYQRVPLEWEQLKAFVSVACEMARQLDALLRLLVTTVDRMHENKIEALGLQSNQQTWEYFAARFCALYRSRMRSPAPLNDTELQELFEHLVRQLLLCSGTMGELRLWHALLDGATS